MNNHIKNYSSNKILILIDYRAQFYSSSLERGGSVDVGLIKKYLEEKNYHVSVKHYGFALRLILKYVLELNEKEFQWLRNPPNCYIIELMYDASNNSFSSTEPLLRMNPI